MYVPTLYISLNTPKSLPTGQESGCSSVGEPLLQHTKPWAPFSVPFKGKGKKPLFKIFVYSTVSHKPLVPMPLLQCAWNLMEGLLNKPLES